MNDKNDEKLMKEFPGLYAQRSLPMSETCMCWGFSVGDGWFDLLHNLSQTINMFIDHARDDIKREYYNANNLDWDAPVPKEVQDKMDALKVEATQVKEKFGGLRFYYDDNLPDEYSYKVYGAVHMAEMMSTSICEDCGNPGKTVGKGWMRTNCEVCVERNKEPYNGN